MTGRWLRWLGYGAALGTVVLAVVLASRFGADPQLVPSPLLGQPAPGFELETVDGTGSVRLGDYEGRIVVVNFFGSWCLECIREHDDFLAASDAFGPGGVRFILINYLETPERSAAYLDRAGRSEFTDYLDDQRSRTAIAYGVFGIPETFFIDETGTVVGKVIGEINAVTLGATIDAIRRGERPGQSVTGDTRQRPDA